MHELFIIRGLPGAGKSTFAEKICKQVVSADMYFMVGEVYVFQAELIGRAHEWCFERTVELLKNGPVAVANTFVRLWEMQRYLSLPNPKTVITVEGPYKNIHNVPQATIDRMRRSWEMYPEPIMSTRW